MKMDVIKRSFDVKNARALRFCAVTASAILIEKVTYVLYMV